MTDTEILNKLIESANYATSEPPTSARDEGYGLALIDIIYMIRILRSRES